MISAVYVNGELFPLRETYNWHSYISAIAVTRILSYGLISLIHVSIKRVPWRGATKWA